MTPLPLPTNPNKGPNPRLVAHLKLIRPHIWGGAGERGWGMYEYICHAASALLGYPRSHELRVAIQQCLGGPESYSGWLCLQNPDFDLDWQTDNPEILQAARLRWIDQLIEEFS